VFGPGWFFESLIMQDVSLQTALPERPVPRLRWWDMALPLAGGVLAFAIISFGLILVAMGKGDAGFVEKLAARLQLAGDGYFLNMGVMAILYLPPLGVMFWIARRKHLEYFPAVPWRILGWAFGGGILYAVAFQVLQDFLIRNSLVVYKASPAELLLVPHNAAQLALGLGLAALLGPFVEEFYFRGFLLSWCREKMPLVLATLINGALFGIVHLYFLQHAGLEGIFVTAVIGVFGALNVWWTVSTGSLWPAFVSHAAYNGAGLILMFLAPGAT
jgi:membrane protease YdiL (CAAX protease family)